VPQTPEPISAVSGPKFTILSGHVEEVLLLNKFFSDCQKPENAYKTFEGHSMSRTGKASQNLQNKVHSF